MMGVTASLTLPMAAKYMMFREASSGRRVFTKLYTRPDAI